MKFKLSLNLLFILGLAVIFIISMCSLAGIAVNSVRELGKNAARISSKATHYGTANLYLERTRAMAGGYSSLFKKTIIFSRLLADQYNASVNLSKFYNVSSEEKNKLAGYSFRTEGTSLKENEANLRFWYWGGNGDIIPPEIQRKICMLMYMAPMLSYVADYYPEYSATFVINEKDDFLLVYYDDTRKDIKVKLPKEQVLEKHFSFYRSPDRQWSEVYIGISGKPVITAYSPIYDKDGKSVGCAGVDIDINAIKESLARFKVSRNSNLFNPKDVSISDHRLEEYKHSKQYSFIINGADSELIAFPHEYFKLFGLPENISGFSKYHQTLTVKLMDSSESSVRDLTSQMLREDNGFTTLLLHNKYYIVTFAHIVSTNWIFVSITSTDKMMANVMSVRADINAFAGKIITNFILIAITFLIAAILVIALFFRKILFAPVRKMKKSVSRMRVGDYNVTMEEKGVREIVDLAISFNFLNKELKHHTDELKADIKAIEEVENEVFAAKKIQTSILPHVSKLFNRKEFEVYAELEVSQGITGNFYDYFMLSRDKLAFLVADVSGKTISAAFYMTVAKAIIRDTCMQYNDDPGEVLQQANKILCKDYGVNVFVSIFLIFYDIKTGVALYSNAGSPNILIIRENGNITRAGKLEPILGSEQKEVYHSSELYFEAGTALLLYSNGLLDVHDQNGNFYAEDRLESFFVEEKKDSAEKMAKNIFNDMHKFSENKTFRDITILTFIRKN